MVAIGYDKPLLQYIHTELISKYECLQSPLSRNKEIYYVDNGVRIAHTPFGLYRKTFLMILSINTKTEWFYD